MQLLRPQMILFALYSLDTDYCLTFLYTFSTWLYAVLSEQLALEIYFENPTIFTYIYNLK